MHDFERLYADRSLMMLFSGEAFYIAVAILVILIEARSKALEPQSPYYLFCTRAGFVVCLVVLFLLAHANQGGFIYARQ